MVDPPVVGEALGHVDVDLLVALALERIAQIGAVHLELAEQIVARGEERLALEADVVGGGLVEDVRDPRRPGLDMDLVAAALALGGVQPVELLRHRPACSGV